MRFQGIALITRDVARLRAFYQAVLCCEMEGDDTHTFALVQGGMFALYDRQASIDDMGFSYPQDAGSGYVTLSILVEDVDAEYERLKGMDVDFVAPPNTYPWGARSLHFRDPDGNIVTFVRPPA